MIGTTISHYKILEKLGEGGMGVVYKAHDTKLDRDVALKFLPHHLAATPEEQARFLQEARAASALNHPNVCTIHDIAEHDGQQFIVMELVEGRTLREIIANRQSSPERSRGTTIADLIQYAIQIGEALQEAHAHGIVHRDVKTDNIMVNSKNQVKVMDFGLAKLKGSLKLTKTSSTVGTLAYMAPEQIQGGEVDARSDIFSFGVTLYEMVTGHLPFRGEHEAAVMYSILNEEPTSIQKYVPDAPPELARIISRALEKDPADRYQHVDDLVSELRRLKKTTSRVAPAPAGGGPSEAPVESHETRTTRFRRPRATVVGIALLIVAGLVATSYILFFRAAPIHTADRVAVAVFENRTGDATLDAFGPLITESVAQKLAGIGVVDVVPSHDAIRTWQRVRAESNNADPFTALGRETGARLIIGGAYYTQGDSILIHASVNDAETGKLLKVVQPIGNTLEKRMTSIELVGQKLKGAIAFSSDLYAPMYDGNPDYFPTYEAFREYKVASELFFRGQYLPSVDYYRRASDLDTTFKLPLILAAFAYSNSGIYDSAQSIVRDLDRISPTLVQPDRNVLGYLQASLRGDQLTCLNMSREWAQRAQRSTFEYLWGVNALNMNRPRETITALARLDPADSSSFRDWIHVWGVKTYAYHIVDEHGSELAEAETGCERLPNRLPTVWFRLRAQAALGRATDIWKGYDEVQSFPPSPEGTPGGIMTSCAVELRKHGFGEASIEAIKKAISWYESRPDSERQSRVRQSALAGAYYLAGRYSDARTIYENLLRQSPNNLNYQGYLGTIAARVRDTSEARRIDDLLKRTNRPYLFGSQTYWRARIAAILGQQESAVALLREALAQGQSYTRLHPDPDLDLLKDYPPFQELVKPKD